MARTAAAFLVCNSSSTNVNTSSLRRRHFAVVIERDEDGWRSPTTPLSTFHNDDAIKTSRRRDVGALFGQQTVLGVDT